MFYHSWFKDLKAGIVSIILSLICYSVIAQTSTRWMKTVSSTYSNSKVYSAIDLVGNIYVASTTIGGKGDADWVITSYSPDSLLRWSTNAGSGSSDDFVMGISVDSSFNVFVTGIRSSVGNNDVGIVKLDSSGVQVWTNSFARTSSSDDQPVAIAILSGNVYVAGTSSATNGFADYMLLKYNSTGTLQWSGFYNAASNNDDFCTAMSLKPNGTAFLTGYSKNASLNFDYLTVKFSSSGSVSWNKTYGGTVGKDDYSNAIDFDASGFVYITGQSFVSASNSDYATIKYDDNGNQKWVTKYDAAFNGIDRAVSINAKSPGQIFVTGSSERASGNLDFATIRYAANGQMKWIQRYNGTGNGNDEAAQMVLDGDNVVISGKSANTSGIPDAVAISYIPGNGNINWTLRYDGGNSNSADSPTSLTPSYMGNIYIAGIFNANNISLVKLNQFEKNELEIENTLQVLSYGLLPIRNNSSAKQIMFDQISLEVDSFSQVRVQKFLIACSKGGLNIVPQMNDSISTFYGFNQSYDWMKILLQRIYYLDGRIFPMVYVDNFYSLSSTDFNSAVPGVAYTYFQNDYPIPSITDPSGFLTNPGPNNGPISLILIVRPVGLAKKRPDIFLCGATRFTSGEFCSVCTPPPFGPLVLGTGSSSQNHEIGLLIGESYNYVWGPNSSPTSCLDIYDPDGSSLNGDYSNSEWYAVLRAMPGYPYYIKSASPGHANIVKTVNPIYDYLNTGTTGWSLSLCEEFEDFHTWGSSGGNFQLAYGGVYQVSRLGVNMQPIYFSFPYGKALWYTDGPDLNICFGADPDVNTLCGNGGWSTSQDYFIGPCQVCGAGQSVFGLSAVQEGNALATTDFSAITNYWKDNAITIGFCTTDQSLAVGNAYTFYADNNSTNDCNSSSYSSLTLVGSLTFNPSNQSYEIEDTFTNPIPPGTNLEIHVQAKFQNGEHLDECLVVTVNADPVSPASTFNTISTEIRGNINNYAPIPFGTEVIQI